MSPPASARHPAALALVVMAVTACASGLGAASRPATGAVAWRAVEVAARRAPSFELIPLSRREDAVLRSQPEIQVLGAGTTSARAKPARPHSDRTGRFGAVPAQARRPDGGRRSGRPSGAAAPRLRAPPSPA